MRKILSLLMAVLFCACVWAQTETTVYYAVPSETVGTYSVKLNVHYGCKDEDPWEKFDMVKTDKTYGEAEDLVYSVTFTDKWDGLCTMQFQLYDGEDWNSQDEAINSWLSAPTYNGKMFVHSTKKWEAVPGEEPGAPVLPVVKLAGSLTSWEEPVLMENAKDSLSASLTLNLKVDHYQLKVVSDGNWLSKAGEGDLFTMKRDYPHVDHLDLINTGDNIKLITDVAGEYKLTWTYADSSLVVTFPAAPVLPKFYITGGEDIVGEGKATWGREGALESYKDTLVLNLTAGKHKFKLITPTDQWLGMEALTDTAYGLYTDDDTNICFELAEKGEVTVIYNEEVYKVVGDFYVAPKVAYYLIGDSAFVVDAGATADKAWTPDAIPCLKDTTVLNLKKGVDYIMRLSLNGTWENHRDFRHLTDTAAGLIELPDEYGNHSIGFKLAEDGKVTVIYIPATEAQPEVFKLVGDFYVYVPVLKDGYYLVGNKYDWTPAAERLFLANEENKGEYYLADVKLVAEDSLKVVYVEKDVITTWYPEGDNYVVDAKHEGVKSIYFRPDGRGGDDWYKGLIYIEANPAPKQYYAKYAPKWEWTLLTEKEGLWLTDTIVYGGIGINITDALEGEGLFYSNTIESARPIAGAEFAEKDTVVFSFNPADSILTATLVGKYVKPVVPMAKIRLVPGVWNVEGVVAKFAAVTWNVGETMEANGVVSEDWFVGTDTVEGEIPAAADSIAFARFNGETVAPTLDMRAIWNHSDKLLIDKKTMIYTISGWPEDGRDYSPGYWGEPPTYELKDGYYLVGNKYEWTPAAERLFLANEEKEGEYYLAEIKLVAEDSLKVVYVEKDVIKKWYPEDENYVVDAKHEGVKTIYFRPDGRGGDDWYKGLIYIEANPAPKQYFAKYAPKWEWTLLTEKEGKWLTDTIIYAGIGININDKAADENNMFYSNTSEEEGVRRIAGAEFAENDTVLFSFNPADSVLTAVLVGKYVKPEPSVSVFGTMTEPAWEVAIPFKMAEDQKSATLFNDNIKAGEYAFKLQVSGEWRSNGFRYHRGFPGAAGITKNEDENMTFVADQEGAYTFEWFFDNDSLAITYPAEVKKYYAKYAPKWEYKLLTEKEGLWLTDTIIYAGTGININDKAEGDGLFYSNEKIEGARAIAGAEFAEKDTVLFSFNPADSVLTATLVGKYVAPDPTVAVIGTMTDPAWEVEVPFKLSEDKSYASLTVENISAGKYEFKFLVNGDLRSNGYRYHRGFPSAAGITKNEDANMTFEADQDGEYTFKWFFANDSAAIEYPAEVKKYYAKYAPKWEYKLLTEKEGLWLTDTIIYAGTGININDKAEGDGLFYSNEKIEGARAIAGAEFAEKDTVLFSFNPADSVLTAVLVGKYVEPTYELKDGFYLVGNKYEWTPAAERLFLANEENPGEYYLADVKLVAEDSLKVVYVEKDVITTWYPEGDNYVVDAKHEGVKTIYFRPDGRGGDDWYKGLIYIEANAPVDQPKFYVTGNAAIAGDKAWTPDAIASMKDTLVLSLPADTFVMRLTLKGTWEGEQRDFRHLTDTAAGLYEEIDNYGNHNIGFILKEAGDVTIIYNENEFKLIGDFYVAPVETAKFYVTGNAALVGADKEWLPNAIKSEADTLTLNLEANVNYELKVTVNGTWLGDNNVKGYNELTEKAKGLKDIGDDHNIGFKLDQAGEVKVVYIAAANGQPEVFKLIGEFHDDTSGFDNIDASEKAVKLIHNGQVVILRGDKVYTIMGQKIQ